MGVVHLVADLGVDPQRTPYFTMKRVHGSTFEDVMRKLRSNDPEATRKYGRRKLLAAFASVCQAVDFAHARGVVYRDIKPSNVMLGEYGEVYVLDWGVAKLIGAKDVEARTTITPPAGTEAHTLAGHAMGTLEYMAPEQLRADVEIDDVYALGAVLFELLTLEPLHRGPNVHAIVASAQALQEAGRALALNPENGHAVETLMSLLTSPPLEIPPEVLADVRTSAHVTQRTTRDRCARRLSRLVLVRTFWLFSRESAARLWPSRPPWCGRLLPQRPTLRSAMARGVACELWLSS